MTAVTAALGLRACALGLSYGLFIRWLRLIKYAQAPRSRPTTWGDWGGAALGGVFTTGLAALHPLGAVLAVALVTLLGFLLWLDTALYRIFTFELGAGGVGGAVLSNLYREVMQLRRARDFFRAERRFALLPVAILLAHLGLLFPARPLAQLALALALLGYLGPSLCSSAATEAPKRGEPEEPGERGERRALLHDFVRPRRPPIPPDFAPRPEHAALLAQRPVLPPPSPLHGVLRGSSVVLLTFESLGTAHLAGWTADAQARARTPFLDSLRRTAVTSRHHFCPAPLTNLAHLALYASLPTGPPPPWSLAALRGVGYKTLYLTTAVAGHYGLSDILKRAGFQHVIDAPQLAPHPEDGGELTDRALLTSGLQRLRALLRADAAPFFLHVHAANTHVPYRVAQRARFAFHDHEDDRGRFLNGVEETDFLFGELWTALRALAEERGEAAAPLLLISSDHGQSFGEKGYYSHASAVSAEQLNVPLLLHHPRLLPRSGDFSTHFDVLPTVLDLIGVPLVTPGFGRSIFTPRGASGAPVGYLLWDGKPSRSTSSCLGLLLGERKYALDLIRGTCIESDFEDQHPSLLCPEERRYFAALLGTLAQIQGIQ